MRVMLAALTCLIVQCNTTVPPVTTTATARASPIAAVPTNETIRAPLRPTPLAGSWLESVTLDDGSEANVSLPLGATSPRPIVVGIHGSGDRPDWSCAEWRNVVDSYAFVVCPRGSAFGGAFAWSTIEQLDRRVVQAVSAVRARYGSYVDRGPAIYAGFSQGANLAPYIVRKHEGLFPLIALDEGGYAPTGGDFGAAFVRAGGKRALLSCSTYNCESDFKPSERTLAKSGLDVRVSKLGAFGHTMDSRATSALHEQWKWLVRDDERWRPWLEGRSRAKGEAD